MLVNFESRKNIFSLALCDFTFFNNCKKNSEQVSNSLMGPSKPAPNTLYHHRAVPADAALESE